MKDYYNDKTILVTGGAGSIGSELVKQLLKLKCKHIIVLDQSELALYNLENNVNNHIKNKKLTFLLADIRNKTHLDIIFELYKPNIVFHTAAYKQLPILEKFPSEGVITNIYGTINLVELCCKNEVDNFMFISTDKAVEPTSVLGMTKRVAEAYINNYKTKVTKLSIIRFGNVYNSSGSAIELFTKQLQMRLPITLTHKDVERYFISIYEACNSIIQVCSISKGEETFIINMGNPHKMLNIAKQMISDRGTKTLDETDIEIIGLRPGEKLSEKVVDEDVSLIKTDYDRISYFKSSGYLNIYEKELETLLLEANKRNDKLVLEKLKGILNL